MNIRGFVVVEYANY